MIRQRSAEELLRDAEIVIAAMLAANENGHELDVTDAASVLNAIKRYRAKKSERQT